MLPDVTTDILITEEETFGPVAPLYLFKTENEPVRMANDTEFGLAAYFYSRDIGRIWRVAEGLEYGIVGINEGIISTEIAPFGGMKESGIGPSLAVHWGSKYGIEEFLEVKYLCMGGIDRRAQNGSCREWWEVAALAREPCRSRQKTASRKAVSRVSRNFLRCELRHTSSSHQALYSFYPTRSADA